MMIGMMVGLNKAEQTKIDNLKIIEFKDTLFF
jgi:hypothetical protein